MTGAREMERLTRCRTCGHPWELHPDPTSDDGCSGVRDRGDGVCRCARFRPPTDAELDDAIAEQER